jgi:hypothetical protein
MGAEVKKLEPPQAVAPDMGKPVRMKYWRCVDTIGTLTQRDVTQDGFVNDGGAQGKVRAIWFYPATGYAVAELEVGWRPGVLADKQESHIDRLIMTQGHGREL